MRQNATEKKEKKRKKKTARIKLTVSADVESDLELFDDGRGRAGRDRQVVVVGSGHVHEGGGAPLIGGLTGGNEAHTERRAGVGQRAALQPQLSGTDRRHVGARIDVQDLTAAGGGVDTERQQLIAVDRESGGATRGRRNDDRRRRTGHGHGVSGGVRSVLSASRERLDTHTRVSNAHAASHIRSERQKRREAVALTSTVLDDVAREAARVITLEAALLPSATEFKVIVANDRSVSAARAMTPAVHD
jgi:hypothetical protein